MSNTTPKFRGDQLALAVPRGARSPREGQPNVVVFFTDQQRWDTAGMHGNPLG